MHQVRHFSRTYRCVTYCHRGFPPSSVPDQLDAYTEGALVGDLLGLLDYLELPRAFIVGHSMGGSVALNFALRHAERCAGVVLAGTGSGTTNREQFKKDIAAVVDLIQTRGMREFASIYAENPARVPFKRKDPLGWAEFRDQLGELSAVGSSLTMQGIQLRRPTIYDHKDELPGLHVPTLIILGDEDEPCIDPSVSLKRGIPSAGLVILPQTGHTLPLEEPAAFNRAVQDFFHQVEHGRWTTRTTVSSSLLPAEART